MAVQISGNDITVPRDGTFSRNVSIAGTLTYEDVTNVDSIGLVTARNGIEVGASPGVAASISVDGNAIFSGITTIGGNVKVGTGITLSPDGDIFATGVCTATSFSGDGSNLTGITNATTVTVANETSDTETFPTFTPSATGNQNFKTNTSLKFNASNGTLTATSFSGSGANLTSLPTFTEYSTQTVGGTSSYSITITGDPKVFEVSLFEVRHVASQNIMYRLSNSGGETTSGYYDIGSAWRHDHNSNSTSRGHNQGQGCLVNYNFNGVNNLITGKAVFTRVSTGLYTFTGGYNHYFHADESSTSQYNLLSNGHVNNNQNSGSTVTQIRIFTSGGGNFTSGTINVRGIV